MSGVLDRQEVLAVLEEHKVGAEIPGGVDGVAVTAYRDVITTALLSLAGARVGSVQVRCTDMEDYARIYNEGFSEAQRQCEADVRTAGAEALKAAAAEQRRLAEEARTNNGQAEHEDLADWLEERADEIPGRVLHCPVGCDAGACESCPCCCAGFCVYGLDGLPDDPEQFGDWLEVAAEHNPVAGLLKAQKKRALPTQEQIAEVLFVNDNGPGRPPARNWDRAYPIARRPYLELASKVLALVDGGGS